MNPKIASTPAKITESLIRKANEQAKAGSAVSESGRVASALATALTLSQFETKPVIDSSEVNTILAAMDKNGVTSAEVELGRALLADDSILLSRAAATALRVFVGANS